ncbi:hypothetical protein NW767_014002 [Fusarium falciforme]|uniref:AB hydrolase-1 domain-containing protein n=1 Tax=Fusarium falciforme TaxID=195108 RepID=A0A9W8UUU1_9HYPO|nr:hypothetical protein NW755_013865 [Fusarium falciforme]KAJ4181915.1 hypothetical protein NW767_014002 [Fusarium falciforme]KAJ4234088.1 hypothetical protein NW757_013697 [Fusarium falciforme]
MEYLQKKTFISHRSLKYTYYTSSGESTKKHPALFFIHGFPDSAHIWSDVISSLRDLPNKIIVPDCLGYAGTDKPDDTRLYAYRGQADEFADLLRNEHVDTAVIIGHDWGSPLANRTYLYHRELFSGVVLVNTGYILPSAQQFDLKALNEATTKSLGYPQFAYWEFFTAPDAAEIVDANLERMWLVLHGAEKDWMKKLFCVPNAMREFLLSDQQVPLRPYAAEDRWKQAFLQQFRRDGFASALQMYTAAVSQVQSKSDSMVSANLTVEVPLLFIFCTQDAVCVSGMMDDAKSKGLVPKLKEVTLECAHWSPMEKPTEIAAHIREFLVNAVAKDVDLLASK